MTKKELNAFIRKNRIDFDEKDIYKNELIFIRNKFLEHSLFLSDKFSWLIINDYLFTKPKGWTTKSQTRKVIEVIDKYGMNSLFWDYLLEHKEEREFYQNRLAYLITVVNEYLATHRGMLTVVRILRKFISATHNINRMLAMHPLTEKQRAYIFRIERIVGVYYNDLPPSENGEIWEERK